MKDEKKHRGGEQHDNSAMAEARTSVFEDGQPSSLEDDRPMRGELDENAVNGPGGDSRPDLTDPATARFDAVDDDPRMTTTRENLPEADRHLAEEYANHRTMDDTQIAAKPMGPIMQEGAYIKKRNVNQKTEGDKD